QGLAAWRAVGVELRTPSFLALVAEVCEMIRRPADGLSAVADALATGERTGQHYWDAELYRLKGALTLQSATGELIDPRSRLPERAAQQEAESCFLNAIEIARRQKAKSLELRAATSLGRLWGRQGKTKDARILLADTYHWFTEGLDTADLSEAKSLLEELERRAKAPVGTKQAARTSPSSPRRAGSR